MLEVGVSEMSGIFQAEAEEAVEADVSGPDQGDRKELWLDGEVGDGEQDGRSEGRVGKVIDCRAYADAGEIAEHGEIWREEEDGEEKPAGVELAVEEDT